ncbi:hypothetical protein [Halosimplex pelagicum]|uniref:Uncharacterized protein n=1 Tax=Halosimplex pelagicum TaxID=869886 RepID=A0A7D5TCD8_9EURY|nr:hypothetical protein [Halosimplex pelagicum]QLH81955.1 hypothetical protein HZS54_10080 [Halosimplex pelagicum]
MTGDTTTDREERGDDGDGERGASTGDGAADPAALAVARAEARHTLGEQIDALTATDAKALKLVQFSTGLLGVVLSVLSFAGPGARAAANRYLVAGTGLLVVAAVVAVVAYTATARVVGIDGDSLRRTTEGVSERSLERALVAEYADWIRFNAVVNRRGALLVTVTLLCVLGGILAFALGVLRATLGPLHPTVPLAALGVLAAACYATRAHRQVLRVRAVDRPSYGDRSDGDRSDERSAGPRIDGQEAFVGDSVRDPD